MCILYLKLIDVLAKTIVIFWHGLLYIYTLHQKYGNPTQQKFGHLNLNVVCLTMNLIADTERRLMSNN
jgi:hypothetical protein